MNATLETESNLYQLSCLSTTQLTPPKQEVGLQNEMWLGADGHAGALRHENADNNAKWH
jgi:hypothetical protein